MNRRRCFRCCRLVLVLLAAPLPGHAALYSLDRDSPTLRAINPNDGTTTGSVTITLAAEVVLGGTGLAIDPNTGVLWALLRLQGAPSRRLVTLAT